MDRNARRNANRALRYRALRMVKVVRGCENPSCWLTANGFPFMPHHFDFDHIDPDTKRDEVVNLVSRDCSWATVVAEIHKCRVLCKICHADHTRWQRKRW